MSKQIHERTAFRLAMLANGFQPLLNDCKRPIEKGWPQRTVDAAEVRSWDRSALLSTGMKIDGDLAAIDADIADASLGERFPALFEYGLVRHAGGPKEAWFARVDEPFRRLASRRWYRGEDPDDPAVPKQLVECFGSLGTRQFAGGASPATVPRAALPVLPKAAYAQACNLFDEIAAAAGLTMLKERRDAHGEAALRVFELDADTEVETHDYGTMTVAELERLMRRRRNDPTTLRCSGTFHDPTRVRTDSHLINWGRHALGIWDAMTR